MNYFEIRLNVNAIFCTNKIKFNVNFHPLPRVANRFHNIDIDIPILYGFLFVPATLTGAPREITTFSTFSDLQGIFTIRCTCAEATVPTVQLHMYIHCVPIGGWWGGLGSNFLRLHAVVSHTAANTQHSTKLSLALCLSNRAWKPIALLRHLPFAEVSHSKHEFTKDPVAGTQALDNF